MWLELTETAEGSSIGEAVEKDYFSRKVNQKHPRKASNSVGRVHISRCCVGLGLRED